METLYCNKCKTTKPTSEFTRDKVRKTGYTYDCGECRRKRNREYYAQHPDKRKELNSRQSSRRKKYYDSRKDYHRDLRFKKEFGISLEEYNEIKDKQNGVCAICNRTEDVVSSRNKNLAVDHCHETGKVRGLLCTNCNRALGLLGDRPEWLKKAIEYLEDFNASITSVN